MDLRETCNKIFDESCIPVATFAKKIGRDSSTLYKWLDGTRDLSEKVENEVREKLIEIKNLWAELDI